LRVLRAEVEDENFRVRGFVGHLQRALRMSLWDAVLYSRVARRSLQRAECSLAGHSSLKLSLNFLRAALFEGVGAATHGQACDHQQDRHAFHLRIL
jgi:hypothetical protein